jgi:hypothetical protein
MGLQWHFEQQSRRRNAIIEAAPREERVRIMHGDMAGNKEQLEQLQLPEYVCVLHAKMTIKRTKSGISLCSALFFFSRCCVFLSAKLSFLIHFIFLQFSHSPFLLLDLSCAAYHGEFCFERGNNK